MLFHVWKSKTGPFIQTTECLVAFGGILSPLVSRPYLIKVFVESPSKNLSHIHQNENNISVQLNCTVVSGVGGDAVNQSSSGECGETVVGKETQIQIAYLIGAVIILSGAIPFLVFRINSNNEDNSTVTVDEVNTDTVLQNIQILAILQICVVSMLSMAVIDSIPGYLTAFGMLQLDWSQGMCSLITSIYYVMYVIGCIFGIVV